MSRGVSEGAPRSILFACTLNRTRSPMAEALAAHLIGPGVEIMSCGLEPCEEFDPFVTASLNEIGVPLDDRPGRGFESLADHRFEAVVALTPEAHAEAVRLLETRANIAEFWPVCDPTQVEGSRDQRLEAYRELRDELMRRIRARFAPALQQAST